MKAGEVLCTVSRTGLLEPMPLLEKTNIDAAMTNGDSTAVEEDDFGVKDDQRGDSGPKNAEVWLLTRLVVCTFNVSTTHMCTRTHTFIYIYTHTLKLLIN